MTEIPVLVPHQSVRLPAPQTEPASHAMEALPWLAATGRLHQVLAAWRRGELAEAPTGYAFDVLRVPREVGEGAVRRMRATGRRVGPVILGPLGVEFIVTAGSAAATWSASQSAILRGGTLVLLPPPSTLPPAQVAARAWLVPPCRDADGAVWGVPVVPAGELFEAYTAAARAVAAEKGSAQAEVLP